VEAGARWIHLVDLDRALGQGDNSAIIERIASRLGQQVQLQLGGGLRSLAQLRAGLELGMARVVIGTAAATDPGLVPAALEQFGSQRLAVGIDVRGGYVAIRGWVETSSQPASELAGRVVANGVTTLVYTDIARDGMLSGPDLTGALSLQATGARVILSGGVQSVRDIQDACAAGLDGVIVGRALYEGRVSLPEALAAAACQPAG